MYGVLVCPRCRRPKGVRAEQKTTTCSCGFTIRVDPRRLRRRVARVTDLPGAVRAVASEGMPVLAARPRRIPRDSFARITEAAIAAGDRRQRLLAAARALTKEHVLFSQNDLERLTVPLDLGDVDRCLSALQRENLIAEIRPGLYRFLDNTGPA